MDVDYTALTVAIDGSLRTDGLVSVWDHGLLYGDGCFEGMRLRGGLLFRPHDHFARLRRSARALDISLEWTEDDLLGMVSAVAAANGLGDAHVRVILTRGVGAPGLDPRRSERPTLIVMVYPFPPLLGREPISLMVSSIARKAPLSVDSQIKSLNYLDGVLAKLQAHAAGAHDAIMLDPTGYVAEGTSANIFMVREGSVSTPTTRSALPGITRKTVIELLGADGVPVVERDITWGELYSADECFLTGSGAGIVPVRAIDGRAMLEAPGAITSRTIALYDEAVSDPAYVVALAGLPGSGGNS